MFFCVAEDEWIAKVDVEAFKADIKALGDRLSDGQGEEDVRHLQKIIRWSNICGAVGVASMWMAPNPLTILALSTWTLSRCTHPKKNSAWRKASLVSCTDAPAHPRGRWTMIGHHVCHGGYNKQDDGTGRFTSHGFAIGSLKARVRDWLDWMLPEVRSACSAGPHLRVASVWPRRAAVVLTRAPLRRPCRAGVERGAQQPAPLPAGRVGRSGPGGAQSRDDA